MMDVISRKEAKAQGLTRYFTGKPCHKGHVSERFVSTRTCFVCNNDSAVREYTRDPEKAAARSKAWRDKYPDRTRAFFTKWRKKNLGYDAFRVTYRKAQKLEATVSWADNKKIKAIYAEAKRLTVETGIEHHVDHYYPLQGEFCCGLHVENNLHILTADENCRKGNQMPEDFYLNV
jgi:hypothetical protein